MVKGAYFELSDFCNLRCNHCHLSLEQRRDSLRVSYPDVVVRFSLLQKLGVSSVILSGGEPTLHPQFNEIADLAVKMFSDVAVMSNNTDPEKLICLNPKVKVWVSLDYFGEKQDKWRGFSGLWQNYISIVEQVNVRSTLLNDNLVDVENLVFKTFQDNRQIVIAPYRGNDAKLASSPQDMSKLLKFIFQGNYQKNAIIDDAGIRQYLNNKQGRHEFVGCSACEDGIAVSPTGQVRPCPFLPQEIGSLYDPEIKQKIAETRQQLLNMFNGKCVKCQYKKSCGGCKASSNNHCFLT